MVSLQEMLQGGFLNKQSIYSLFSSIFLSAFLRVSVPVVPPRSGKIPCKNKTHAEYKQLQAKENAPFM